MSKKKKPETEIEIEIDNDAAPEVEIVDPEQMPTEVFDLEDEDTAPASKAKRATAEAPAESAEEAPEPEPEPEEETVPLAIAEEYAERARRAEEKLLEFSEAHTRYREEHDRIRARLERDQDARVRESLSGTFRQLLDALDNLERTFAHAEDGPLVDGLRLVHKQFLDILAAEGLERLEVVGETFDPATSEAVLATPVEDEDDAGKVLEEFRPGYRFRDVVLRAAQVRVGRS